MALSKTPDKLKIEPTSLPAEVDCPRLILQLVEQEAVYCVSHPLTLEAEAGDVKSVTNLLTTTNWAFINDETAATQIWKDRVCSSPVLLDYVMRLTRRVSFSLHGWGLYERALDLVAMAYSRPEKKTVMHQDLINRIGNGAPYRDLLEGNPWLLVMLLVSVSDGIGLMGKLITRSSNRTTPGASGG
jgi:hypothetical protein